MLSGACGKQRPVVKVQRIDAADLDAWDVVVARRVAVSATWTDAAAGTSERRRRVGRLTWSRALLP